jgi:SnoaL-like domain
LTTATGRRGDHTGLLLPEVADRQAIRELVDAYAHWADSRDAAGQLALFTEDVDFAVFDGANPVATHRLRGRAALAPLCQRLNAYQATMHINGQSTTRIDGARAWGVTCCMVHYLKIEGTVRSVMISAIHYLDSYVKRDGAWLIRQRQVMIHWTETRPLTTD